MRVLKLAPHLSTEELKNVMNSQKSIRDFKDYHILYLVAINYGKKAKEIASMLGITVNKVFKTVEKYNRNGIKWKEGIQWGGRRDARCHLSLDEEKLLMKSLEDEALLGKFLTFRHIKDYVEIKAGKEISEDYIWDLFSRHGWSKKMPRPYHPKTDKETQEEYKKNSRKIWLPTR